MLAGQGTESYKNVMRAESGGLRPLLICGVFELIVRFCLSSRVRDRAGKRRVGGRLPFTFHSSVDYTLPYFYPQK